MASGNFFNAAKTEVGYLLNPKNYNRNPLHVTKEAYAPAVTSVGNRVKNTANSALEYVIDSISLSDEAKHELENKGRKGIKAKSF